MARFFASAYVHVETTCARRGTYLAIQGPYHNIHGIPTPPQVIGLVMEALLLRQKSLEQKLKILFAEGDDNGDGVLSFEEFSNIVARYRTIISGDGFTGVCRP